MKDSVCAVVVTYNRKNLLMECLEALRKQTRPIQGIYLIDNASTDCTPELLLKKGYITELPPQKLEKPWEKEFEIKSSISASSIKLHYVRMHENVGGAGGFYEGVKRGYEKGYDWLWLMDDDAEPKEDALEILSLYFDKKDVVGLAGTVLLLNGDICTPTRGRINLKRIYPLIQIPIDVREYIKETIEIDMASFVGLLVKKEAIEKVGFPKKEFFIYHDDVEYSIRLRSIGKILLVTRSVIIHKGTPGKKSLTKTFLGKKFYRVEFNKLWLSYYSIRNLCWLGKMYSKNKFVFYLQTMNRIIKSIIGIILFDDFKYKRIMLILNAYLDGLRGNFDNSKPRKILYGNDYQK
jgi:GT2 family glycosyltransferase